MGKIQQRQAGNDRPHLRDGLGTVTQQLIQVPGITVDDVGPWKTFMQQLGQIWVVLDGDQPVFAQAALQQGIRYGTRARSKFQHIGVPIPGQPVGHGSGQMGGTGRNGTGVLGISQPLAQEKR